MVMIEAGPIRIYGCGHSVIKRHSARFLVFKAMKTEVVVYWLMTPCRVVVGYQPFGGPCCHHLQCYNIVQ